MLVKQGVDVSFAQGLDTKTDPKRVTMGKFLKLQNSIFTKGGLLQKRNGYGILASLPDATYSYLTTFNGNLTALGPTVAAYNSANASWIPKGTITPLSLTTLPVIRNNLNQSQTDIVVAPNGLACAVYSEVNGGTTTIKYVTFDSVTGQNITAPVAIPVGSGTVTGSARVFVLGVYFVIVFTNVITATSHLQYIAISTANPTVVTANADLASAYSPTTNLSWDGFVAGNQLFFAYNTTTGGQAVQVAYLTSSFIVSAATRFATFQATGMSVTVDATAAAPVIYVSFYTASSNNAYTAILDHILNIVQAPTLTTTPADPIVNVTSYAQTGTCRVFFELQKAYSFDAALPTNYVAYLDFTTSATALTVLARSIGLASKAFLVGGKGYVLTSYSSAYQPTYFLIAATSKATQPIIAAKLAYQNGGGYLTTGLPSVTVSGSTASIGYLFKDLIQAVNKNTAVPSGTQVAGIYSQTGVNLVTFTIGTANLATSEIGDDLHLTGGFLGMYDGYLPVEHNFFLWPDTDQANPTDTASWSAAGGAIHAQPDGATNTNAYFYQFTYEWTDNQGNAFRSAPSIPIAVTTTGAGTTGSITLNIPTLRLTAKTSLNANPVKIVAYRWSVAQPAYYQVTSLTAPLVNDTTVDSVQFIDTLADASILGNNLLYTTGGVLEDVNAPASNILTIFDDRLWLVDAEDPNLLWYSKTVIEATPVEMSDLLTFFVAPTVGTATGKITSAFPMDDKLIISKGGNSFVYINGTGPTNTGDNNQYSEPVFITSTVGCSNQRSIIAFPKGLMFQSNKGIWALGRDLSTSYIGAPVESLTAGALVTSAVSVPRTNQIRFTLDSGITLMYDYFYDQWGTFVGVPAVSSTIFQDMHSFINAQGGAYLEQAGVYVDGGNPVLMMFQTGPLRLGDLQNYQRAFFFYLLGTYFSPHKLQVSLSYDYEPAASQTILISPTNFSPPFGADPSQSPFGQGSPFGGPSSLETWRVFLDRQRCMAFQIQIQEIFDASFGAPAGAGLTLSGLNIVMGFKKAFRPPRATQSAG